MVSLFLASSARRTDSSVGGFPRADGAGIVFRINTARRMEWMPALVMINAIPGRGRETSEGRLRGR